MRHMWFTAIARGFLFPAAVAIFFGWYPTRKVAGSIPSDTPLRTCERLTFVNTGRIQPDLLVKWQNISDHSSNWD